MAQGFVIPLPQWLWDSTLQEPAEGWKVYYTNAGLGTPVTTYSDAGLTSQNTDPVITANGTWRAFVAEAVIVDIEVKNASDVSQFTLESIVAMPDTSGSSPSVTAVPTGGIIAWSTSTAPTGFLLCNGAAVSRSTYSDLNTLLSAASYPFGSGNGTTTFNVPDLRQRFPLGVAASGTGSTLGGTGGAIDHTHTGPSHTHTVSLINTSHSHTVTASAHTHNVTVARDWGGNQSIPSVSGRLVVGDAVTTYYQPIADRTIQTTSDGAISVNTGSTSVDSLQTSGSSGTGNTGTANAPFIALWYIIKT